MLLLKKPEVVEMLEEWRQKLAKRYDIQREELIYDLVQIKNENIRHNPSIAIKAIETLAKLCGFIQPANVAVNANAEQIQINLNLGE